MSNYLEEWADKRETSKSVAMVIFSLSTNAEDADRIWQAPTEEEFYLIRDTAFLIDINVEELYWGGKLTRDSKFI